MTQQNGSRELAFGGKLVTVLGLAREGTALVRFLVSQGSVVTATDLKGAEQLEPFLSDLAGLPVRYCLGGHPETVLDCDLMFVSPGVPLDAPTVVEARRRGLLMSSEARLFCRQSVAPVVGVTGSSGKTTTCALVAEMARADGRLVHLGGNIGTPLISKLQQIQPTDTVVTELSSFQLDWFGPVLDAQPHGELVSPLFPAGGWSPRIAAVLNVTPNHLDRHPTMADYTAAKRKIVRYQSSQDCAVLGWDDPVAREFRQVCAGSVCFFSLSERVPRGAYLANGSLVLRRPEGEVLLCPAQRLLLRGMHNVANMLAACAISDMLGITPEAMVEVAQTFRGVEHRLELVRLWRGVSYYNDSIATSPERAIAALQSFEDPIVLLAGGRDKHLPWEQWADVVSRKATRVIAFGEAADLIEATLRRLGSAAPPLSHADGLSAAVELAEQVARVGDVVLLSPGGTSFDAFRDFEERGHAFKRLVHALGTPSRGSGVGTPSRSSGRGRQ